MLDLRPSCEQCGCALPGDDHRARICSFECTFCADCATWQLHGVCPNCGGELVARPRRPTAKLVSSPAVTQHVRHEHDIDAHCAGVAQRLRDGDLPEQEWLVSFASRRSNLGPDGGPGGDDGYAATADEMARLAASQPGFLGADDARDTDGVGITVSRWSSLAASLAWRGVATHTEAQHTGRARWYDEYRLDVARVDRTSLHGRER